MNIEDSKKSICDLLSVTPPVSLNRKLRNTIRYYLSQTETASELAACLVPYLSELYAEYGEQLSKVLSDTLSPEFWKDHGVLFNPVSIPSDGSNAYIVLSDLTPVVQEVNKEVTYLGNVTAKISAGTAHIMDSSETVTATGHAKVYAHGRSSVNADNESEVFYLDRSHGIAHDMTVVHACDRTYVSLGEGHVTLYAHDMAQFAVFHGGATVIADGSARGIVAPIQENNERIMVHLSDLSLLATKEDGYRTVVVETEGFSGTLIRVKDTSIDASLLWKLITPRYERASSKETGLNRPLDIGQLKNDLKEFIDNSGLSIDTSYLFKATDERALCARVAPFLPHLIANGLTGEFLRTHFTEQALEESLIHAFSRPETIRDNHHERGTHYFFGDQLVHAGRYGGNVACHEKALLIVDKCGKSHRVEDQAAGIVTGTGNLAVCGESRVISMDHGNISAKGKSHVYAYGNSFIKAEGHAWVEANYECSVVGTDHCRVSLSGRCKAQLSGYAKALALDSNYVVADDYATVYYRDIHKDGRQVVKALAPTVQVQIMDTEKERDTAMMLMREEQTVSKQMKR